MIIQWDLLTQTNMAMCCDATCSIITLLSYAGRYIAILYRETLPSYAGRLPSYAGRYTAVLCREIHCHSMQGDTLPFYAGRYTAILSREIHCHSMQVQGDTPMQGDTLPFYAGAGRYTAILGIL